MSKVEELLSSLTAHEHQVIDTDSYFEIDPATRDITRTTRHKNVLMQYDHNSQRYTFKLPRYIDGHDMALCTSVVVNFDNIDDSDPDNVIVNSGPCDMEDLRVNPDDAETVISSWLISRASTQLAGTLSFSVEYKCVDDEGNVVYEWGTNIYSDVEVKPRKKNADATIAEHVDILEQWRTKIFGAGDSVMADIVAEGETQVAAVKAESETQQVAVELKGAQTLDSIPEDYTEVDAMAEEAVRSKADAIICEAAGESIVLKDSSNDYIRGLNLFGKSKQATTTGKNLFNHLESNFPKTMGGVTFTYNDGVICLNGTCDSSFNLKTGTVELIDGIYTLSANNPAHNGNDLALVQVYNYDTGLAITAMDKSVDTHVSGALTAGTYECRIRVQNGVVYNNFKISPQLELGEIATSYEPYTGGKPSPNPEYPQDIVSIENPTVCTYGKNLLDVDATLTFTQYIGMDVRIPAGKYILSWDSVVTEYGIGPTIGFSDNNVWVESKHTALPKTITLTKDETKIHFYSDGADYNWSAGKSATINGLMLSVVGGDYESYKPAQTLAVTRTLPGIPVTSGGNYADSDGQQWICDEVDLERGVYVQRIKTVTLDGSDNEGWMLYDNNVSQGMSFVYYPYDGVKYFQSSMCDKYRNVNGCWGEPYKGQMGIYSDHNSVSGRYFRPPNESVDSLETWLAWLVENPLKLMYILAAPIETPLTAEEITAFKTLHTNYPNTTILNDAGAWMSVKYNADTKTYVENPKTLKLVDSSTGVVYELKVIDGVLTVTPA